MPVTDLDPSSAIPKSVVGSIWGVRVMLQRFLAIGLMIVGLLVGLLFFEVRALRRQQMAAVQRPSVGTAGLGASQSELSDLAGQVVDFEKNPLPYVDLLVILKTWPDGRYRQQAFSAKTNNKGHFRLKNLVPLAVRHAVQVAALCEGYALQSVYHLRPDGATRPLEPVKFELAKATLVTLLIQDGQGRPVPNVRIAPASRKSPDGQEHLVYFQASAPVHLASDAQGRVALRWFSDGDQAELLLRVRDEDWESRIVDISRRRSVVEISVPSR